MDSNSRAARILRLSLSQCRSDQPNRRISADVSNDAAAEVIDDILFNNTENNCINLDVLENISGYQSPSSSSGVKLSQTTQDTEDELPNPKPREILELSSDAHPLPTYASTPKAASRGSFHEAPESLVYPNETPSFLEPSSETSQIPVVPSIPVATTIESITSTTVPFHSPTNTIQTGTMPCPLPTEEENMTSARKRKRGPDEWRQNVMKRRRELGQEYERRNGGLATARTMGEKCNCKSSGQKECAVFSEDDRLQIFHHIWTLSWDEKRNFLYGLVDQLVIKRKRSKDGPKNRQYTLQYSLKKEGQKRVVCLKMFLSTTGLTKHFVSSLFQKKNPSVELHDDTPGEVPPPLLQKPKQQRSNPHYQRSEDSRRLLHQFLDELPKLPSHYSRKSSSKLYLERCFKTLTEVHSVYEGYCSERSIHPLKLTVFKDVFYEKNISLFKPKKDRCNLCIGHEVGNVSEEEWKAHMEFKNEALMEKESDKEKAIRSHKNGDRKFAAFCMDLQSVLLAPNTEANAMYFKTKLTVHNFTVYNLASGAVSCYVWNETEGGMTANEFASCILHYLEHMDKHEQIVIFSDGCTYQNRNVILANALQHFVNSSGTCIQHKYLVCGHTHMEVDNSHSLIERALAGRTINVPYDYVNVMEQARNRPSPFNVRYLSFDFFRNFTGIGPYESIRPGKKVGDPTVTNVHCYKYQPDSNGIKTPLRYKLKFSDEYKDIPLPRHFDTKPSGFPSQLYSERLKIPRSKFQHLQELKAVIGKDYHSFYDQLLFKQ